MTTPDATETKAFWNRITLVSPSPFRLLEGVPKRRFFGGRFEEPRISEERYPMAESEKQLVRAKTRPYSVAFRLKKPRP